MSGAASDRARAGARGFSGAGRSLEERARLHYAGPAPPLAGPPMPATFAQRHLARHGLLAVALLAALGLLGMAWSSRRGAEALADTVDDGQAERMLRAMREHAPPDKGGPTESALRALLEERRADGLRGIAMVQRDGTMRVLAGTVSPVTPQPEDFTPGPHVRRVGSVVHVFAPPASELAGPPGHRPHPPRRLRPPGGPDGPPHEGPGPERPPHDGPPAGPRGPAFGGPPPDGPPGPRDGRPPQGEVRIVLEMEPLLADSLIARANRTFAIAAIAAAILVAAAAVLWRRAGREDALAERLAHSERLASLGTMSAVLAHEIKNPLAALKGNAQLVSESLGEGSRPRAQADRVVEAAERLQTLVANLLDFARSGDISREDVDPGELLFLAACEAAPKAQLSLDAAPALFSLDPVRMGQVLENLLRNAEQASPDRVSAEARQEGERLVVVVRDEGPGFSGAPEAFFEPFATTKARGTGLGLAVARRIVEQHGGTITARNRPEGGAEIRLEIPPARSSAQ